MEVESTEAKWQKWVREHAAKFLLFARQKARCEADAQDLVQEAVLEATQRSSTSGPPPTALVFATIHRRAIDLARREDRRTGRERATPQAAETWFDSTVEQRELEQLIEGAMKQIPEIYREVVTLKIWGELTFAEIGETLGIPQNTAASRYRYGVTELRKITKGVLA